MRALFLLVLMAQSGAPATDGERLDRIRSALSVVPAITIPATPDDTGKFVFRVRVEAWTVSHQPWEQPRKPGDVPSYVRPSMPLAHYEFLQMVTPEAFRASTLYHPVASASFDPVVVRNFFAGLRRAADERHAREEVRRDIEAYLLARGESR